MGERRGSLRHKSFLRGFVYFDRLRGVMSCLVRDLSETGARIVLSETAIIPDVVQLHIPQREETRPAHVQWRRGDEIGLAFTDVAATAPTAPGESKLTKRLAQLEADVAELQRVVKRLKRDSTPGNVDVA
jgi:hypothetical protein